MPKFERMIVWQGPSELTGEEIIVLATKAASPAKANMKTGDMIQISILRADVNPTESIKQGLDKATCGPCPFRSIASGGDGGCYTHKNLRIGRAQTGSWNAHDAKGSRPFDVEAFRDQKVRFGSYGDPAAVPFEVWESILEVAKASTGYTHQWRTADPRFARMARASADSPEDRRQARMKGYNTFRVMNTAEGRLPGEILCPASKEAGNRTNCETCLLCGGTDNGRTKDVAIFAH